MLAARQTDMQKDRHAVTPIAIICTLSGGKIAIINTVTWAALSLQMILFENDQQTSVTLNDNCCWIAKA